MPSPLTSLLRRLAVVFATAQVVLCALAPAHRSGGDLDRSPSRFEAQHQHAELPGHDPDTCAICQLLTTPLIRPEVSRAPQAAERSVRPLSAEVALPAARGPPTAHQTRAPPSLLV